MDGADDEQEDVLGTQVERCPLGAHSQAVLESPAAESDEGGGGRGELAAGNDQGGQAASPHSLRFDLHGLRASEPVYLPTAAARTLFRLECHQAESRDNVLRPGARQIHEDDGA
jgi:hypothetical protein